MRDEIPVVVAGVTRFNDDRGCDCGDCEGIAEWEAECKELDDSWIMFLCDKHYEELYEDLYLYGVQRNYPVRLDPNPTVPFPEPLVYNKRAKEVSGPHVVVSTQRRPNEGSRRTLSDVCHLKNCGGKRQWAALYSISGNTRVVVPLCDECYLQLLRERGLPLDKDNGRKTWLVIDDKTKLTPEQPSMINAVTPSGRTGECCYAKDCRAQAAYDAHMRVEGEPPGSTPFIRLCGFHASRLISGDRIPARDTLLVRTEELLTSLITTKEEEPDDDQFIVKSVRKYKGGANCLTKECPNLVDWKVVCHGEHVGEEDECCFTLCDSCYSHLYENGNIASSIELDVPFLILEKGTKVPSPKEEDCSKYGPQAYRFHEAVLAEFGHSGVPVGPSFDAHSATVDIYRAGIHMRCTRTHESKRDQITEDPYPYSIDVSSGDSTNGIIWCSYGKTLEDCAERLRDRFEEDIKDLRKAFRYDCSSRVTDARNRVNNALPYERLTPGKPKHALTPGGIKPDGP
jgi:hypothetical protein